MNNNYDMSYLLVYTQRNRCSCFLHLGDNAKAAEAIQQSKTHDTECPQAHFLAFKLAILQGEHDNGNQTVPEAVLV